jgi:hypothetical protein
MWVGSYCFKHKISYVQASGFFLSVPPAYIGLLSTLLSILSIIGLAIFRPIKNTVLEILIYLILSISGFLALFGIM